MTQLPEKPVGLRERAWRALCRLLVAIFYRRVEVTHLERVPEKGGILVCANHLNSMFDAILLQAAIPRPLCPLARSGHFTNPTLWPLLSLSGALPVYRPRDPEHGQEREGVNTERNAETFASCHRELEAGGGILIFPEGKSHSDPRLQPLKTGAARIALGTLERTGRAPSLIPASLTFSRRGKFRSSVLIQIGKEIQIEDYIRKALPAQPADKAPSDTGPLGSASDGAGPVGPGSLDAVREVTHSIYRSLARITLNAESWQDLDFLNRLDRFYQRRRGRQLESRPLALRFRSLQKLIDRHRELRVAEPDRVARVRNLLRRYERLCRMVGASEADQDESLGPRRWMVLTAVLLTLIVALPIAVWGALSSGLPYLASRHLGPRLARKPDQIATSKLLVGLILLPASWGAILALVYRSGGWIDMGLVAASLPLGAAAALFVLRRHAILVERLRMVWLLRTRHETWSYLMSKRHTLETEIAALARLAKQV